MPLIDMDIKEILAVIDTREYEERGDRFVPIPGSGETRRCTRCGRGHEVHAHVLLEDGSTAVVGTGCMHSPTMEKRAKSLARKAATISRLQAKVKRLEYLEKQYSVALDDLATAPRPPVTTSFIRTKDDRQIKKLHMGGVSGWVHFRTEEETLKSLDNAWMHLQLHRCGFDAATILKIQTLPDVKKTLARKL